MPRGERSLDLLTFQRSESTNFRFGTDNSQTPNVTAKAPPTPSKVARSPMNIKKHEKIRLEKEEAKWQKSVIRKPVTSKEKWLGRMENNKETTLEEEFVSMAFGEPFVKELKMGIYVGSWMCPW
ncbi:hypothetical protein MHU86_13368 [Fragilaria crotonensis]|nr:hypothetical protein MHU86_13368 [Fragilaria crotonensis]